MIVKIMGYNPNQYPDHDPRVSFRVLDGVKDVRFSRFASYGLGIPSSPDEPTAYLVFRDDESEIYVVDGNAYVMTDEGKTISTFSGMPVGNIPPGMVPRATSDDTDSGP